MKAQCLVLSARVSGRYYALPEGLISPGLVILPVLDIGGLPGRENSVGL